MGNWQEAHDALLDLYTFSDSPRGRQYAEGFAHSVQSAEDLGPMAGSTLTHRLADRIAAHAFNSDPIYVDPEMMTLWEAATESFDPEPLHPQDLITPNGFVWLPRALPWRDVHDRVTSFRAFMWAVLDVTIEAPERRITAPGVVLMTFHRVGDRDDYDDGRGNIPSIDLLREAGGEGREFLKRPGSIRPGDLIIDHVMPWLFGADYRGKSTVVRIAETGTDLDGTPTYVTADGGTEMDALDRVATDPRNVQRPVQCLWRLLQQTIATRDQRKVGGQYRSRAQRAKFPEREVVVVTLRRPRPTGTDHNAREVEWTHRWIVSGHWRRQFYPSIGLYRQIWISPYVKGPDDQPLEVRKVRAFQLVQ